MLLRVNHSMNEGWRVVKGKVELSTNDYLKFLLEVSCVCVGNLVLAWPVLEEG